MKKKCPLINILILLLAIMILFVLFLIGQKELVQQPQVCFRETCFDIEIADTPAERARGLMFREHLEKDRGMLFIFEDEGIYSFWMKNTLISLDMIWMSKDGVVVFVKENAQPCSEDQCPSINPGKKAKYVLELNSGILERIDLEIGQRVILPKIKE